MTNHLDVLLLESPPGASDEAAAALVAAGHEVHRCHEPGERGFPCKELTEPGSCPVDRSVQVALLVRDRAAQPTDSLEDGVTCAIRAGVPLVEQGSGMFDALAPWVARHLEPGDDVVTACADAAEGALAPLATQVVDHITDLLFAAGIEPAAIRCRIVRDGAGLQVHIDVPTPVDHRFEHALGVRALAAIRSEVPLSARATDVHVHELVPLP